MSLDISWAMSINASGIIKKITLKYRPKGYLKYDIEMQIKTFILKVIQIGNKYII
jgi:hypothetical protein